MRKIPNSTAVILCGGKSSRMGFDKSLLRIEGEYVLLKTIKFLEKLFPKILLVTDRKEKFPVEFFAYPCVEDHYPEKGPLGGLVTALESVETKNIFLLACDIPMLNPDLILQMVHFTANHDVVICKQKEQLEPLFGFYTKACLPVFQRQLDTKDWRIKKEFNHFSLKIIRLKDEWMIKNVNVPMDLFRWQQE